MMLPISYLLHELDEFIDHSYDVELLGDFNVHIPEFYDGCQILKACHVYIDPENRIPCNCTMERGAFVLRQGGKFVKSPQIICVPEQISLYKLCNRIYKLFEKADDWERRLSAAQRKNDSLLMLLKIGSEYLPNPLRIMSLEFEIVEFYSADNLFDESADPESTFLKDEFINALKSEETYSEIEKFHKAFVYRAGAIPKRSLSINLFSENMYIGRINMLEWVQDIQPWQGYFLEILRDYMEPLYVKRWKEYSLYGWSRQLLYRMIRGETYTDEELTRLLSDMRWSDDTIYKVIDVHPSAEDVDNHTLAYFIGKMERLSECLTAVAIDDDICLLLRFRSSDEAERLMREITLVSRDANFRMGISRGFSSIGKIKYAFFQAKAALSYGGRKAPHFWKHDFETYVMDYFIDCCTCDLPPEDICAPALITLKNRDERYGSDLYGTLKCYLEHQQNAVRAAKELFIHRGTMVYRLEQIRELTGVDFSSPTECMYLLFSYYMLERDPLTGNK